MDELDTFERVRRITLRVKRKRTEKNVCESIMITGVSWKTLTIIAILLINADTAVTARIAGTLVHVDGTFRSRPSCLTGTIITAGLYGARRNKQSKRPHTDIYIYIYIYIMRVYIYIEGDTDQSGGSWHACKAIRKFFCLTHIIVTSGSLFAR